MDEIKNTSTFRVALSEGPEGEWYLKCRHESAPAEKLYFEQPDSVMVCPTCKTEWRCETVKATWLEGVQKNAPE